MAYTFHFVAGGAADGQFDAVTEAPQVVFEELAEGYRKLRYASFYNPSATTAAHVKLFWKRQRQSVTFGGSIGDGDYVTNFDHPSLPTGGEDITTTRAGGTPADAAALAVQHEADIEAGSAALLALIDNADDDGVDTNDILTEPGVRDLTITTTPPGSATMVVDSTVLPALATDLQDETISIPASSSVQVWLGDRKIFRLYVAASQESGVGATAPDADIVGYIVAE